MRVDRRIALALIVPVVACTYDREADAGSLQGTPGLDHGTGVREPSTDTQVDLLTFDLVQRNCALYVAMRSGSLISPIAFGRDMDGTVVRWNMCSTGTMVACASTTTANGDTVRVGIPWPHPIGAGI
jgi:hypothetical protein